jgi:hypothetical protein
MARSGSFIDARQYHLSTTYLRSFRSITSGAPFTLDKSVLDGRDVLAGGTPFTLDASLLDGSHVLAAGSGYWRRRGVRGSEEAARIGVR